MARVPSPGRERDRVRDESRPERSRPSPHPSPHGRGSRAAASLTRYGLTTCLRRPAARLGAR
ncbi:hypothetical protein FV219_16190 [Methylobacterium sp. WL122]|nr:hypothetical protein FV219_16190 [Methylobacterium sp. WL122]